MTGLALALQVAPRKRGLKDKGVREKPRIPEHATQGSSWVAVNVSKPTCQGARNQTQSLSLPPSHNLQWLVFAAWHQAHARWEMMIVGQAWTGARMSMKWKDLPGARDNILARLRLRIETGEQVAQTSSLIGAAGLLLQEGNLGFAAQLLGAVESTLKALNAPMESEMKPIHEQTLAKVKEALGEAAFQSAWEKMYQWSLEEAVKKVLGDDNK